MPEKHDTIDFLIAYDQEILYETRDHLRERLCSPEGYSGQQCAAWMREHYETQLLEDGIRLAERDWLALAESCIADTQELMEYEEAHGLPSTP